MTGCALVRVMLLKCLLLLSLSGSLGQKDCTGVDCPELDNCIEESLDSDACCATCVQKGCTCQGYQYYDCVNAGFRNGKVAEGESYFVDFGSTECACPEGGGRISCHFIPCPDIPANCIELSEPADGCIQCKRIGCVHDEQKYEAGHSFHMDPCQVCHCPNDGGSLMCYPIPDCDPRKVEKPMLATTTEENAHERLYNNPLQFIFQHQGPRDHLSKPFRPAHGDSLPVHPLFTQHPNNLEDEEEVDYDYMPTDTPGPPLLDVAAPTKSSIVSVSYPESFTPRGPSLYRDVKQELRETFAVHHEATPRVETTQAPATTLQQTTPRHRGDFTTASWQRAFENIVFPLRTSYAEDHDEDAGESDIDEEHEMEEAEERTVASHGFPVFAHGGKHTSSFADHRHDDKKTQTRPVVPDISSFADHGRSKPMHTRPAIPDTGSFADRGQSKPTQTRPVIPDTGSFADRGSNKPTQTRPVIPDTASFADHGSNKPTQTRPAIPDTASFADHGSNKPTQTRPAIPDTASFADHGSNKPTQTRPAIPDTASFADHGSNKPTQTRPAIPDTASFADRGQSKPTQTRPVILDTGSFANHGRNRNTQSRPVIKELDQEVGTFTDQGLSKITQTRPAIPDTASFADHGSNKPTQTRPAIPDTASFADHGSNKPTQTRPAIPDTASFADRGQSKPTQTRPVILDTGSFANHGRNRNTQSRPVIKELDQEVGTFTDQGLSKITQTRPLIPDTGSFADHGSNKPTQTRPAIPDTGSFADHGSNKPTQTRPAIPDTGSFADHGSNKPMQTRPAIPDTGSFADHGLNRNTHSRPVMKEVDQGRGTLTDHGHNRNTQSRPVLEDVDRHRSTSLQQGHSEATQTRPVVVEMDRDRGSLTDHETNRNPLSRPVLEELDRHRATSPQQGHSESTQSRPNTEELDRDRGFFTQQEHSKPRPVIPETASFAEHDLNRNTQNQPVIEDLDRLRGTSTEHGHSKTRPDLEEADQDSSTFPQQGDRETSQTRPVMAEMDRDKGSFADHARDRNPQSRPVMEEVERDRVTLTDQGHSKATQSRPVTEEVDQDKGKGHQPRRPSQEHIAWPPVGPQDHVTPPAGEAAVNYAQHTTHRPPPQWVHQIHTLPPARIPTTSQPALRVKADAGHPVRNQSQAFTSVHAEQERERERERVEERDNSLSSLPLHNSGAFAMRQVERCCEVGKKWAVEHHHCSDMPTMPDDNYILCSVVQEQCCTGALRQSRCLAGMSAARGGDACQAPPDGRLCGEDSYQECCSCCSLGLQLREAGLGCHSHQYLDYPCGHILLTCCEEEEEDAEGTLGGYVPDGPALRRKEMPRPTATPEKVSDRKFPKEAFSAGDGEDAAANSLEETGGVDACQTYAARLCHHICINTWGSYQCVCRPGHVLLQDGHTCAPEDSEEDNRVREEERPVTQATSRLATSTASTTTTATTTTTTQIPVLHNPCAGNGPCAQRCSIAGGRAKCSCFPGFSLMADGHSCEDVDECITNTHTCKPTERCVNTLGAFVCERHISCSSGYQPRNGVCEDIDECVTRTHNCGATMECRNTEGSFSCVPKQQRCYTGFTQDTHGNCIDIDECSSLAEPCSSGFNCINTVGSYTCQRKVIMCSPGYHASPDGARCIDIDECQTGIHRCGEGQICQNVPGSYRCNCQTGYQYDAIRQTCVDVNECWRYPGRLCAQTCENTPGSYQCSCTAGFSLAFDGKNCEDVNECDTNPCSQECANIYGSYQCYCRQGFYLKEDGHTCEDIDECSQSIGHLCAFQCVNVPGSYQCACPPSGYTMSPNGRTCRDIDECAIGSHNCSLSESCFNIQGGFRCLSFACPSNYRKVSDTRCERVSCLNVQDCQSSPLRITYYQLSFQTNIVIPAQIFRIGPSPAYAGDSIMIGITRGNEEGYFSTRRLNSFTGAVYLQRQVPEPRDFLVDVEMKLLRQGTFTTFLARIYVFITANAA
ncbi:fibulin-2 isoform X2 [Alosa sapidissima]|uniref:fibulin-2 isoform X2 n=1 Tax=Alosa sapidissima TaxID=34773 RepID=UPI001C098A79|nr:fibulin-2 isoform X2 [Alosa sapidissima]